MIEIWTGCLLPDFTLCQTTILYRDEMGERGNKIKHHRKKKNYICACCFELALVGLCWGIFSSMRQTWIHGISKAVFSFKCVFVVKNFKVVSNNYTIAQSISILSELFSAIFWPRSWIQYMSDGDIVLVNLQLWAKVNFVRKKRVKWSHLLPGKKRKTISQKLIKRFTHFLISWFTPQITPRIFILAWTCLRMGLSGLGQQVLWEAWAEHVQFAHRRKCKFLTNI